MRWNRGSEDFSIVFAVLSDGMSSLSCAVIQKGEQEGAGVEEFDSIEIVWQKHKSCHSTMSYRIFSVKF